MGRPRSDTPKSEQLNIRLTPELAAALDVIRAIDEITPQEFVRELLEARVAELREDPDYQAFVRLRERRRAARESARAAERRGRFGVVTGDSA